MRRKNYLRTVIDGVLDRRQCALDSSVIFDLSVFYRDIEVHSDKDPLIVNVDIPDRFLSHSISPYFIYGSKRQPCFEAIYFTRSRTRHEYPHSLSYQESILTAVPPITFVFSASTIDEFEFPRKSIETRGSSENA